jgi:hypothetical protein
MTVVAMIEVYDDDKDDHNGRTSGRIGWKPDAQKSKVREFPSFHGGCRRQ